SFQKSPRKQARRNRERDLPEGGLVDLPERGAGCKADYPILHLVQPEVQLIGGDPVVWQACDEALVRTIWTFSCPGNRKSTNHSRYSARAISSRIRMRRVLFSIRSS